MENLSFNELTRFVEEQRGPSHLPLEVAIPVTIVYVLIFITGLLGNLAVCLVIIRHPAMHTATNYYLFNLAISDLILLIFGLPHDAVLCWHQYPWRLGESFCKFRTLLSEMASYVSVLTIVAFSTERYLAICHPLYLYTMSGLQRAIKIIACIWLIAFFSALPFSYLTTIDYLYYPINGTNQTIKIEESAFCGMFAQPENMPLAEISAIVFFVIPLVAIGVQYTEMGRQIAKSTRKGLGKGLKGSVHRDSTRNAQSNRIVIRMLAVVVIGFFACWAPFHAQRLTAVYDEDDDDQSEEILQWVFFLTGIAYYFQSTMNPILYNVMSDRYRTAFREVLCGHKISRRGLTRNSTIRDTNVVSHVGIQSQYTRNSYHLRSQKCMNNMAVVDVKDEDKLQLVDQEVITVSMPKSGSTLIYEINFTKDNEDFRANKPKCETRM